MRISRLTLCTAIAGAIATPLALAAPASAASGGSGSAFALSASGLLLNIPPTPAVSSTSTPKKKSIFDLPHNKVADLGLLRVEAAAGHASAKITDLKVTKPGLSAELITAKCDKGVGSSHLVHVSLAGQELSADASPNSAITVPIGRIGTASVVLNKQVKNQDGSLTVTAIEITLPLGREKVQTISIASATCKAGSETPGDGGNDGNNGNNPGSNNPPSDEAPVPTPVNNDLPVTG